MSDSQKIDGDPFDIRIEDIVDPADDPVTAASKARFFLHELYRHQMEVNARNRVGRQQPFEQNQKGPRH